MRRPIDSLLIAYPELGNAFYIELAQRLHLAAQPLFARVSLASSAELCAGSMASEHLAHSALMIVNPRECSLSGSQVIPRMNLFSRRIAVISEAIETGWYREQFRIGVRYDAVLDVGFVDQGARHPFPDIPYRFVFNGPTEAERHLIESRRPTPRPIRWAVIGHCTLERLRLVAELAARVTPAGFVFLPSLRPVHEDNGRISPAAVRRVLSRTSYYVWCSHHPFPYYESLRFIDCMLTGAVPCKIGRSPEWMHHVPGTHGSAEELSLTMNTGDPWSHYRAAREFYLSREHLTVGLEHALRSLGLTSMRAHGPT